MILVYYGTVPDGAGERLQRVIEELVPEAELDVAAVLGKVLRRSDFNKS